MAFKTKLHKKSKEEKYLRVTIPVYITETFGLTEGDALEWDIGAENNELILKVKPIKKEKKNG